MKKEGRKRKRKNKWNRKGGDKEREREGKRITACSRKEKREDISVI